MNETKDREVCPDELRAKLRQAAEDLKQRNIPYWRGERRLCELASEWCGRTIGSWSENRIVHDIAVEVWRPYQAFEPHIAIRTGLGKVGKQWLWCVWRPAEGNHYSYGDPDSWGYTATREEGLAAILKFTGATGFWGRYDWCKDIPLHRRRSVERRNVRDLTKLDNPNGTYYQPQGTLFWPDARSSAGWRHDLAERRRKPNTNCAPDAAITEFLYHTCHTDNYDSVCRHRVFKKTAKRIFFEGACVGWWHQYSSFVSQPMQLNRSKLEAAGDEGLFVNYGRFYGALCGERFYLKDPSTFIRRRREPECIAALGLKTPTTIAQVKRAYRRLSRAAHPDHGGTNEAFIRLQQHYEQALSQCTQ
jgi:hypothetical protein